MTDRKNETGKGPAKPGEPARRPYATIDLQATEVRNEDGTASVAGDSTPEPEVTGPAIPPAGEDATQGPERQAAAAEPEPTSDQDLNPARQRNPFATHVAAGVAGGAVTVAAAALFGLLSGGDGRQATPEVANRIAALEEQVRQRPVSSGDVNTKLAQADTRLKGLEEQSRTVAALTDAQNKLAANIKALEGRGNSPEVTNRLSKIETNLAALSANERTGQAAALADKLTALEKQVTEAIEASKSGSTRIDRMLADAKTDAGTLTKRIDALKADIDERLKTSAKEGDVAALSSKVGTFERDLQGFLKGESDRSNNAARVLVALEIANLKRAMDRGDRYTDELKAVQKLAGNSLNLAPLQKYADDGVPTLPTLTKEFRQVADAATDAEAEPADGSVLDRLMSGARSIVRVRKAGYDANDQSTEAVLGRMETGLKEGRLDEVMVQGSKLPPKAALVAEDWLKKVEARRTVDRALADIEMAMKTSLTAGAAPAAEPKK